MKKIKHNQISLRRAMNLIDKDNPRLNWLIDEILSEPATRRYLIQRGQNLDKFATIEKTKFEDFRQEVFKILRHYKLPVNESAGEQPGEKMIPFERLAHYFKRQLDAAEVYLRCEALAKFEGVKLLEGENNFFLSQRDYHICQRAISLQLPEEKRKLPADY